MVIELEQTETVTANESSAPKRRFGVRALFDKIEALKIELQKVSWTSAQELKLSTKIVIVSIFSFGFGIYCVDFVVKGVLDAVATAVRLVFG